MVEAFPENGVSTAMETRVTLQTDLFTISCHTFSLGDQQKGYDCSGAQPWYLNFFSSTLMRAYIRAVEWGDIYDTD